MDIQHNPSLTRYTFEHFVEFSKSNCIFGLAREEGSQKTRLFLLSNATGRAYTRNARSNAWEDIPVEECEVVRIAAAQARQSHAKYFVSNTVFLN